MARTWCRGWRWRLSSTITRPSFKSVCIRRTSDIPETIIIDHAIAATTLEEVTPPPLMKKSLAK